MEYELDKLYTQNNTSVVQIHFWLGIVVPYARAAAAATAFGFHLLPHSPTLLLTLWAAAISFIIMARSSIILCRDCLNE